MIVIVQGVLNFSESKPIMVASSMQKAKKWLRGQGYKEEKQPYGDPLFIHDDEYCWCDLVKVELIK